MDSKVSNVLEFLMDICQLLSLTVNASGIEDHQVLISIMKTKNIPIIMHLIIIMLSMIDAMPYMTVTINISALDNHQCH